MTAILLPVIHPLNKMGTVYRKRPVRKNGFKRKAFARSRAQRRFAARKLRAVHLRRELKFFDTSAAFTYDATGEVPAGGQWSLIPQGDTSSTRDGRQALVKSIEYHGLITGPSTAAAAGAAHWMFVILDTQCNGAAAAVLDVFTSTNLAVALRNLNNSKRFKILHKEVIAPSWVGREANANAQTLVWPVMFHIPCNIMLTFNSTAGAITELTENNIFIIAGSSAVDDEYTNTGTARLRFYSD